MLEFDAYQRTETTARILRQLPPPAGAVLLDVGGYPGRLRARMPEYRWVICDPLVDSPGDQVMGSAARLPFANDSFHLSVSLDVLEHIPPTFRSQVITEISRVSKEGFILSFPNAHPAVESAEQTVRQLYEHRFRGRPHPWLEEHRQFGLPDAAEIRALAEELGYTVTKIDLGAVQRWQWLQTVAVMMEGHPEGFESAPDIDAFYREKVYPHDFTAPSYRVVLVCIKKPLPIEFPLAASTRDRLLIDLELQAFLMYPLTRLVHPNPDQPGDPQNQTRLNKDMQEYISRLETGLQLWEDTCARLNQRICEEMQWRDRIESHPMMKLFRKIRRLIFR